MNGRRLAIGIGVIILLGAAYATLTIRREKDAHFARAAALKDNLNVMRTAIDNFHTDEHRYPSALQELVPKYLRTIPADPVTGSASTWRVTTEQAVQPRSDFSPDSTVTKTDTYIIDIHSGATGKDANGIPFAGY